MSTPAIPPLQGGTPARVAPRLVFAIGNASRGDDAIGPVLAEALRAEGWFAGANAGRAELIEVYQLQVEDALELQGRSEVLFVDAVRPPAGTAAQEVSLSALQPAARGTTAFTHALAPAALLEVYPRLCGTAPPPAALLAVAGCDFELGAPLSAAARDRLPRALVLARRWLDGAQPARAGAATAPVPGSFSSDASV